MIDVYMGPPTYALVMALKTEGTRQGVGGKQKVLDGCLNRLLEKLATGEIGVEEVRLSGQKEREGESRRTRIFIPEFILAALHDLGIKWAEFVRCAIRLYHDDSERRELERAYRSAGGTGDIHRYSNDFLYLYIKHAGENDPVLGRWLRVQKVLEDRLTRLEELTSELLKKVLPMAMDRWLEVYGNRIPTETEIREASVWELRVMLEAADLSRGDAATSEMRTSLLELYYGVRLTQISRHQEKINE